MPPAYHGGMSHDADDLLWEAFVAAALAAGPAEERRSRYGDKPALFTASREIAHLQAPGVIDLRITRAGWSRVQEDFGEDPAVRRDPSRRDWIELHPRSVADLDRLGALLTVAMAANALPVSSCGGRCATCGRRVRQSSACAMDSKPAAVDAGPCGQEPQR